MSEPKPESLGYMILAAIALDTLALTNYVVRVAIIGPIEIMAASGRWVVGSTGLIFASPLSLPIAFAMTLIWMYVIIELLGENDST